MKRHTSVGRYDVGVLVLCAAFTLVSLGAVGSRGRTRAKEAVCRAHLRQWASVFDSSTQDNDGFFPALEPSDSGRWWIETLWPYHQEAGLLVCPTATGTSSDVLTTHRAWRVGEHTGSYGLNGWIGNRRHVTARGSADLCWPTPRVWVADRVPVLADMFWADAWPREMDIPQATEQQLLAADGSNEMQRVCVNRHDGSVNVLFIDGSVRKVGLKELWTLRWNRTYNTQGPWTMAGGVQATDWPEWMRQFKEFHEPPGYEDW